MRTQQIGFIQTGIFSPDNNSALIHSIRTTTEKVHSFIDFYETPYCIIKTLKIRNVIILNAMHRRFIQDVSNAEYVSIERKNYDNSVSSFSCILVDIDDDEVLLLSLVLPQKCCYWVRSPSRKRPGHRLNPLCVKQIIRRKHDETKTADRHPVDHCLRC